MGGDVGDSSGETETSLGDGNRMVGDGQSRLTPAVGGGGGGEEKKNGMGVMTEVGFG